MKILNEKPPILEQIIASGMMPNVMNTVFTYGDVLYNPGGHDIPDHLMVHEEAHSRQQEAIGKDEWWSRYLDDPYFRIQQEVEAYARQYEEIARSVKDRNQRNQVLLDLAKLLSSPTYGNVIERMDAYQLIKDESIIN